MVWNDNESFSVVISEKYLSVFCFFLRPTVSQICSRPSWEEGLIERASRMAIIFSDPPDMLNSVEKQNNYLDLYMKR